MRTDATPRRSVLISGCSTGIGHACAHGLAARGWRVFASARATEDVARLRDEGLTDALQLDVDDPTSIDAAVARVLAATGGRLDGLFNNAGYGQPGAVEDLSREVLRAQFETNVFGLHQLTCRVLPAMRAAGAGRIVHNSSIFGLVSMRFRGAYQASKHAVEALADTLRQELDGSGIHVSLIEPGPVRSRFRDNARAAFERHIDTASGPFAGTVYPQLARRLANADESALTLPESAVLATLVHALESPRPRARYYVTLPTHVFGTLRRVLGTRTLDRLLLAVSRRELR